MPDPNRAPVWLDRTVGVALFALMPAAAWSSTVGGVVFWLLALAGLAAYLLGGRVAEPAAGTLRLLWIAALSALAINAASVLGFGLAARDLSWWPMLGLPLVGRAVVLAREPLRRFVDGSVAACFVAMAAALWSRWVLGEPQPMFMMNPLLFGNLSFVATMAALWDISMHPGRARRWLSATAAAAGTVAFLASGFRGGVLALPLLLLAFLHVGARGGTPVRVPWRSGLAAGTLALAMAVTLAPRHTVFDRLPLIRGEVQAYFHDGRVNFSNTGSRLAMWSAALQMVLDHPVVGVGAHQYQNGLRELRRQGRYPEDVNLYRHAHNTYLTILAEYGIGGTLALTVSFGCALAAMRRGAPEGRSLGLWLLAAWMVFALTNDILSHQSLIRMGVATVALFACLGAVRRVAAGDGRAVPATAGPSPASCASP